MKTAIAINCLILTLLATSNIVMGGSTTIREYQDASITVDGGYMQVKYVSGIKCRTWGVGGCGDGPEYVNATQWAEDIEKHTDSMESTDPRWELYIDYWYELQVGVGHGSEKGESSGTAIGMVWGDMVGADGYALEKDLSWDEEKIGTGAFSYQAVIPGHDSSPLNYFTRKRENTTGTTIIYHSGIYWDETVLKDELKFYTCSRTVGHMRDFEGATTTLWFEVNDQEAGSSGDLPGLVLGFDDSGPEPEMVSSWLVD